MFVVNVLKRISLCLLLVSLFGIQTLWALDLELTQGINAALPIGIQVQGEKTPSNQLAKILTNDFYFSGQFKIVPTPSIIGDTSTAIGQQWRRQGADHVISAHLTRTSSERYELDVDLIDAAAQGKVLLSKNFQVNGSDLRSLAHHISDLMYQKLTGERGVFSTKIAYILVQGHGEKARYFLEVADVDGYNPQRLLVSSEPIMSPTWSPDGKHIAYVSFEKKHSQIFTVDIETGKRRLLTAFAGINGAPAWSPDGRQLAVVLSKGGAPKIYTIDLTSGKLTQLTFGEAIDTEPRFSPDGKSLLFTSGRGGAPQIYRLALGTGQIQRLTYEGNYNARASYTPDQQSLVILHRDEKDFNIAVQDNTGRVTALTFSSLDESPSVSPNGRLILYATHEQDKGILGMVSVDGRIRIHLPTGEGNVQEPAWSPYLG